MIDMRKKKFTEFLVIFYPIVVFSALVVPLLFAFYHRFFLYFQVLKLF